MEVLDGFVIYWKIENFDPVDNFFIKSQPFLIPEYDATGQIQIELDTVKDQRISVFLNMLSDQRNKFCGTLFILTSTRWISIFQNDIEDFNVAGQSYGQYLVILEKLKREKEFYLPNGSLTIGFHIFDNFSKNNYTQRLLISRFIDGETLHHRPIQTFSTLEPSDLFNFPHSYDFQSNSMSPLNAMVCVTKAVESQHTVAHFSVKDCEGAKEMKTRHTQTDAIFIAEDFNKEDMNDLRKLFQEKEFSFVTFRTPTKEFSVHKAVLCAKSPVFNSMFEIEMKENDSNIVDINDIDNQTMTLFVKFLQFDPLNDLKFSSALSLYYAADKYQIDPLKQKCVSILKKELSTENVCEVLLLADLHQDSDLMNYAQEYFCKNSKAVTLSKQWKDFLINPELVAKLLCKLAETMP